tara:strand:+ start:1228 stop:1608 length:381 start_codon:yes stop_codon:yes gene_type:complete
VVRRFFLYLIGVGLGVIVSIFFFGDRDIEFSYLPNARTLKHLRGQAFQFSEKALCQLNCISMTESSFEQIFYGTDLDVDFGGSDVGGKCRTYLIEVTGQKFSKFNVDDCDSTSTLLNIDVTDCKCL